MASCDPIGADPPLAGVRVVERSRSAAAAYAGRLLSSMGAEVMLLEPAGGSPLRRASPIIADTRESALFAFLCAGKRSLVCDLDSPEGRERCAGAIESADILVDDTPVGQRESCGLTPEMIAARYPHLIHASVLPFGAFGPKSDWDGEEINLLHASGEGFLLPNGFSHELFPDRPPLKIYGHFAGYQAGAMAALGALSAFWSRTASGGQFVDVSIQDAGLAVGAFALQRLGDGSLEHRATRKFRYGGVFETSDGYIELLTLEDRQWASLVELLGRPAWALDPAFADPLERSRRGDEINQHIRAWMRSHPADVVVTRAQELGVPVAKYRTPIEVSRGEHERARGLFARGRLPSGLDFDTILAPFRFLCSPAPEHARVPALDEASQETRG